MKSALPAAGAAVVAKGVPLAALWPFPSVLFSAFLVSWGAEAAQFLVSQGLALAMLAWLQTLPEFAVEAVIAWEAGRDPTKHHLAIANFTGSIRLLVGLGWPLVYFVAAFFARRTGKRKTWVAITFDDEHSIEIMGLLPPLLWFTVVWWKGSLGLLDAAILTLCYAAYLVALLRIPPRKGDVEEMEDLPAVSKWALAQGPGRRGWAITGIFVVGGAILLVSAHAFVESMLALAITVGVSPFVFVQWVAPFLSEFPEKLSAFTEHWQPRTIGEFNGHDLMLVKVKGEFVWHKHDDTDDFFLVLKGRLTIQLRDGHVVLGPGEIFVVPKGVEHCPVAEEETHVLLIEPTGTPNTGDRRTAAVRRVV